MCKTIYRYTIINDKEGKAGRILGSLKITYWKKEKCKKKQIMITTPKQESENRFQKKKWIRLVWKIEGKANKINIWNEVLSEQLKVNW